MTPYERLIETRRLTGASSWRAYAAILGLPNAQTFTDIRIGKYGISRALCEKIRAVSPEVSSSWLLTGEGTMMQHEGCNPITIIDGARFSPSDLTDTNPTIIDAGSEFNHPDLAARNVTSAMAEYPNDAIIICKKADPNILVPGTDYLFITPAFIAVRRLQRGDTPSSVKLYATNPEAYPDGRKVYEPIDIEKSLIQTVYNVIGYILPSITR